MSVVLFLTGALGVMDMIIYDSFNKNDSFLKKILFISFFDIFIIGMAMVMLGG